MKLLLLHLFYLSIILISNIVYCENYYLTEWDILAPFPSAPREDVDVLNCYGGIDNIPIGDNSTYISELINGARVGWSHYSTNTDGMVNLNFSSDVNWDLINNWAGSSGTYFSGWGISTFSLDSSQTILVTCSGIAKFWVDSTVMQGDSYGLGLQYNSIELGNGIHTLKARIIGSETASYQCEIITTKQNQSIFIVSENTIVPDIVDNEFTSPYISIAVLNILNQPIDGVSLEPLTDEFQVSLIQSPLSQTENNFIGSGQLIPINFIVKTSNGSGYIDCPAGTTYAFSMMVYGYLNSYDSSLMEKGELITLNFTCKSFGEAYTFTFQDYDLSIQYADAIPPNDVEGGVSPTPVLFALHGAGVNAKSGAWTNAFQVQNYTWILLPTNRANYGFDWEEGGIKNALMALDYLCNSLPGVANHLKSKYQCDPYQLQVLGHSMGGHGSEHFATAISPDRVISLSIAAGWIDMKLYSPNFLRVGYSWSHPMIRYILDSVVSQNDADFHSPHLINIPIIIRMGSDDDNVPPFHGRRLLRLYDQLTHNTSIGLISEIPGEGHWFNGVVDDAIMQAFLSKYSLSGIPLLPDRFLINCLNPGSFQGKGGISIQQAIKNFRVSKISVDKTNSLSTGVWSLSTENVKRFGFNSFNEQPNQVIIDGQKFNYIKFPSHYCTDGSKVKKVTKKGGRAITSSGVVWSICNDNDWMWSERSPLNSGPMVQILDYPILIVYGTIGSEEQTNQRQQSAVYLSNVLMYQMRYSINVLEDTQFTEDLFNTYNVIFMGGPQTNKAVYSIQSVLPSPIGFHGTSDNITFSINDDSMFSGPSIGLLFLSSCYSSELIMKITPKERYTQVRQGCMLTVIEGTDSIGFQNSLFNFPTKSSFPMPDFMILGPNFGYQGVSGANALGFWDNNWQLSDLSYFAHDDSFYAIGGICEFDVSMIATEKNGLDKVTWVNLNLSANTTYSNIYSVYHNETSQVVFTHVICQTRGCEITVRADSTDGKWLYISTSPVCLEIPSDFTIEKISNYSYNYFRSSYSCYVNVRGLVDDISYIPKLSTSDEGFKVIMSFENGTYKLTFTGVPLGIAPIWYFQYIDGSITFNISSPFNSSISYENYTVIQYVDSIDHIMNYRFDYPQYWINIKPKERYPYIKLIGSYFNPKIVSNNDDGSPNYFLNLRMTNPGYIATKLSLQNYSEVYQIIKNFQCMYEGFYINSIGFDQFNTTINDNGNYLISLIYNFENFTSRDEIGYEWTGGRSFFESFPFGFSSGNNTKFSLDISLLKMNNFSNFNYQFLCGGLSYSFDNFVVQDLDKPPIITQFNILDTFTNDNNKVLFRLNYSTPTGISKIELKRFNDFNYALKESFVYTSTDFKIVSGDLKNGVLEFIYNYALLKNDYITLIIYDINSNFTTLQQNNYYQSFLDTFSFPQLYQHDFEFRVDSISNISFIFNNVNLTNAHGYNIMYLETYNTPLLFDPCLQIMPQWDNITINGEWINSRYEFKFYMPPNIVPGAFEYVLKTPSLRTILNTELPDEYQLNVISDHIDLMGPIVTTMNKNPNTGVASINNESYNISWTITINDYNGYDKGYVIVIGSIDNILYNVSIVSPSNYPNDFTYQLNITLNNKTCISQTYSIAEMVLYDRYGLNSTFYINKGEDYTPNINPLYKIQDRSLYSIETVCPGGSFIQPTFKSFDFSPKSIDVGSSNRNVTFTYGIGIGDGIKEHPYVYLTSVTLQILKCTDIITTQINSTYNEYKCTLTIPYAFGLPQDIMVNLYGLIGFGSYFGYSSYTLQQLGYPFLIKANFTIMSTNSGVITGASSISTEGGSLYIYGRFPNTEFNVEFSQGYSLKPSKKSGLIIKVDGVKPSNVPFTIKINNTNSKSNLYEITPYKIEYFKTILTSKCKGTPICGGPTHGTCNDVLGCICNSPWVGVDCNSKVIIIPQPVFNTSSPTIVLNDTTSSDNSGTYIKAEINVVSIREIDFNNKVLHMYSFDKWVYNSINLNFSTYSSNIVNKNGSTTPISVNIEYFENQKTIQFAGQEIEMKPSSLKYTINIGQYPFSTRLSQLQLVISATAMAKLDSDSCSNKEFDNTTSTNLDYVKLSLSGRSLYGRFIRRALVDYTPITISNELLDQSLGSISDSHTSQSFIGINIPIYNKNVVIDPDFSLIINSNPTTNENSICSKSSKISSRLTTAQLAGIVVGSVGFVAIVLAAIVTIRRKRALKREMKIFGKKLQAIS
ncbi:hypothetical protein RB653_005468 [Dictyostelium firmibasis]|uniref:EGF-like domain-containing protein n=1 Tax=Dictyostelium firmibasis TaxID=79012 RepID=A0AAN7YSZ8_9MYCE